MELVGLGKLVELVGLGKLVRLVRLVELAKKAEDFLEVFGLNIKLRISMI